MEHIRKAIELAKELAPPGADKESAQALGGIPLLQIPSKTRVRDFATTRAPAVQIDSAHLALHRIVAHERMDPRSRAFDMLRTQVLQTMDSEKWRVIAITSPTPSCGKTLTSVNLAVSIARQPERSVVLVDLDLQKPQIAQCLGLPGGKGVISVLEKRSSVDSAMVEASIGPYRLSVLPCESKTSHSSEWMASAAMRDLLQDVKSYSGSGIVVLDMPPMLTGDDVISILPQVDCVLFVAAIGTSKSAEIKECYRHLRSTPIVRVVLNKVDKLEMEYYY